MSFPATPPRPSSLNDDEMPASSCSSSSPSSPVALLNNLGYGRDNDGDSNEEEPPPEANDSTTPETKKSVAHRWFQQKRYQVETKTEQRIYEQDLEVLDNALSSFSYYNNQKWFPTTNDDNDDWILDGHAEWQSQYAKTQRLLKELHQDPLNVNLPQQQPLKEQTTEFSANNEMDTTLLLWKFGSVGNQEFQFAAFDDAFPPQGDDDDQVDNQQLPPVVVVVAANSEQQQRDFQQNSNDDDDDKAQQVQSPPKNVGIKEEEAKTTPPMVPNTTSEAVQDQKEVGESSAAPLTKKTRPTVGASSLETTNPTPQSETDSSPKLSSANEQGRLGQDDYYHDAPLTLTSMPTAASTEKSPETIASHSKESPSTSTASSNADAGSVSNDDHPRHKMGPRLQPQKLPGPTHSSTPMSLHSDGPSAMIMERTPLALSSSSHQQQEEDDDHHQAKAPPVSEKGAHDNTIRNATSLLDQEDDEEDEEYDDDDVSNDNDQTNELDMIGQEGTPLQQRQEFVVSSPVPMTPLRGNKATKSDAAEEGTPLQQREEFTMSGNVPMTPLRDNKAVSRKKEHEFTCSRAADDDERRLYSASSSSSSSASSKGIPTMVQLKMPSPMNLTKVIMSPLAGTPTPGKKLANLTAMTTTTTPGSLAAPRTLATPKSGNLSLTSELASPEGRFWRRQTSQAADEDEYTATTATTLNNRDVELETTATILSNEAMDVLSLTTAQTTQLDYSDLNIPSLFFDPDPDDSPYLSTLEWEWWPWVLQDDPLMDDSLAESSTNLVVLLHDELTQKLSSLDSIHRQVSQRLHKHVAPHALTLYKVNQVALELTQNYKICQMYLQRCQESLQQARFGNAAVSARIQNQSTTRNNKAVSLTKSDRANGTGEEDKEENDDGIPGGVQGACDLLEMWDRQASYRQLQALLEWIQELYQRETGIAERIERFDICEPNALEECQAIRDDTEKLRLQLLAQQQDDKLKQWAALQDMQHRISTDHPERFVQRLHEWLESLTVATALTSPSPSTPMTKIGTGDNMRTLDYLDTTRLRLLQALHNVKCPATSVAATIQTALLKQSQKAWGLALLNPTVDLDGDEEEEDERYDKELLALSYSIQQPNCNHDVWISNLMTIRLDWERLSKFPSIYHKLCVILCRVLYGAHSNYQLLRLWISSQEAKEHKEQADDVYTIFVEAVLDEVVTRRASIWNACIQTLERSLEEYVQHMNRAKESFKKEGRSIVSDNSTTTNDWFYKEWEGLCELWRLTHQFLSLRNEFGDALGENANDGSCLKERLETIFKHHLRMIHVEAMNHVGKLLYEEDWAAPIPFSFGDSSDDTNDTNGEESSSTRIPSEKLGVAIQKSLSRRLVDPKMNRTASSLRRSQCNLFCKAENYSHLAMFRENGNPFNADSSLLPNPDESSTNALNETTDAKMEDIYNLLGIYCDSMAGKDCRSVLLPKAFLDGVLPWASRLILVVRKVPAMAGEACNVFASVFDLYTTTIFRICSGSGPNENILLEMDRMALSVDDDSDPVKEPKIPSSPLFGFRRRSASLKSISKKYLRPSVLSNEVVAEISAPIPREREALTHLRKFLKEAQGKLAKIAKLDLVDKWVVDPQRTPTTQPVEWACQAARILEQRQVALWSFVFLATALQAVGGLTKDLDEEDTRLGTADISRLESLGEYAESYRTSVPILVTLLNRICCVRTLGGKEVVQQIVSVGSGWEESKLHEHANNYVESLCDQSALIWCSLSNANKLSTGVLSLVWENIVEGGYLILLDGFSRVQFCSTEGRALMSMDLMSYSSGIRPQSISGRLHGHASTPLPPDVSMKISRGMRYVDTYIKVFYFPPKDAMAWIEENYEMYLQAHATALIVGAATSSNDGSINLAELVAKVAKLYK